jgi:hypothetical protein
MRAVARRTTVGRRNASLALEMPRAFPVLARKWVANKDCVRQPAAARNGSSQQEAGRRFGPVHWFCSNGRHKRRSEATSFVAEWMKWNVCGLVRHSEVPPPAVSQHAKHWPAQCGVSRFSS